MFIVGGVSMTQYSYIYSSEFHAMHYDYVYLCEKNMPRRRKWWGRFPDSASIFAKSSSSILELPKSPDLHKRKNIIQLVCFLYRL